MSSLILRILAYLALAWASIAVANGAEAGVMGSALSSFGQLLPGQTIQFGSSNCYYPEGWNGRGWYQCGDEWNDGFGWIGLFNLNTFGGSALQRHHQHTFAVSHPPAANPVYPPIDPSRGLGARGAPASLHSFGEQPFSLGNGRFRVSARAEFALRLVSTPAPRPSLPVLRAGDSTAALAAAIFITFTTSEFPTSARPPPQVLPTAVVSIPAVVCMGLAGPQESTSARPPPQVLPASVASIPAAASMDLVGPQESASARLPPQVLPAASMGLAAREEPTSAGSPPQVLPAAAFMEGAGFSRAAGRGSDRAASDIAERSMSNGVVRRQ